MDAMAETNATPLERARIASDRGDWRQAYELLTEADASSPLDGPGLALLAAVAYAAGHLDVTIEAWERAHAASLQAGDNVAAAGAAVRVAMHLLFDTALLAPVRGWLTRAERLLAGYPLTPVHAWLAVVRNYERLLSGDVDTARHWARQAVDIGAGRDPAAVAIGRVAEGRSLILMGEVAPGLELLNEAGAAVLSGEIDPLSIGVVYCELVCALQALGQYDLAEQWTEAMERWRHGQPVGSVHGRCRVHRAEILRLRGCSDDAEQEILLACDELRPYLRREFGWPLAELGRIRFRKGNIHGAEQAFLEAHRIGWDPQPGLALVYLVQGDVGRAMTSIRDALDRPVIVPSKEWPPNTKLRRAPLLEAQVEIAIAAGDLDNARLAAHELGQIATTFQSRGLAAGAIMASAHLRLAEGDRASACGEFDAAAHQWQQIGAPYETAQARLGLSRALKANGHEERAVLEFRAAHSIFEAIGAKVQAAGAAASFGETGAQRVEAPSNHNAFCREGDYWSLAFEGRLVRVRDAKGLRYLLRLLAEPGREFHVLDLVALERAPGSDASLAPLLAESDAGEMLDARAKAAYRRRLAEIEEDLADAHAVGDIGRAEQAETERDILVRELSRAVGLGGRNRRAGSTSERARSAVTRAIRQALGRIRRHHPTLSDHLERTVRTGTYCVYLPDPGRPMKWKT
jgi:tetratricopeptide (TPR) repeat protein